jgi:hypothetical protein
MEDYFKHENSQLLPSISDSDGNMCHALTCTVLECLQEHVHKDESDCNDCMWFSLLVITHENAFQSSMEGGSQEYQENSTFGLMGSVAVNLWISLVF